MPRGHLYKQQKPCAEAHHTTCCSWHRSGSFHSFVRKRSSQRGQFADKSVYGNLTDRASTNRTWEGFEASFHIVGAVAHWRDPPNTEATAYSRQGLHSCRRTTARRDMWPPQGLLRPGRSSGSGSRVLISR